MPEQPNILLITDDEHRWDFFDNRTVPTLRTPALDRLRREGTTLTNGMTNCPICVPTRMTWLYGLYAAQISYRMTRNSYDWPTHLHSVAHGLQQSGYHTAMVGKLHAHPWSVPHRDLASNEHEAETRRRGFDDVFETSGKSLALKQDCQYTRYLRGKGLLDQYRRDVNRRCDDFAGQSGNIGDRGQERYEPTFLALEDTMDAFTGRQAQRWLREYRGTKPFFLHASFCGPHYPLDPPRPYFERYRWQDMPLPVGVSDPARIRMWQEHQALYCGLIEHIDHEVAQILDVLDQRGLTHNTVVIFTTDHGDMMGHKDRRKKLQPYDTSARTPVLVRYPNAVPEGRVLEDMVEAVDLPCTLLDIAGRGPAEHYLPQTPGMSFWDYVRGKRSQHRSWAFTEAGGQDHWSRGFWMARERNWKYIYRPDRMEELYDMQHDAFEMNNLIADPTCREHRDRLRMRLMESLIFRVGPNGDEQERNTASEWIAQKTFLRDRT